MISLVIVLILTLYSTVQTSTQALSSKGYRAHVNDPLRIQMLQTRNTDSSTRTIAQDWIITLTIGKRSMAKETSEVSGLAGGMALKLLWGKSQWENLHKIQPKGILSINYRDQSRTLLSYCEHNEVYSKGTVEIIRRGRAMEVQSFFTHRRHSAQHQTPLFRAPHFIYNRRFRRRELEHGR